MAKNFEVGMILQTKGGKEAQKEIENVQKNIDNLRKKAIELNKEFKEKQVLKADTKEVEQKLKDVNKQLSEEKKIFSLLSEEMKRFNEEAKKAPEAMEELAGQAKQEKLRALSQDLRGISDKLMSLGKDFISEAATMGKYESQIKNLSKSSEEAAKSLNFIKQYAMGAQPFNIINLTQASAEITKFHLEVTKFLPRVSDLAAEFKVDVAPAAEVVSKALNGTRGGIMQLATEYGATKEVLASYGAELTKSGEIEKDSVKTKEAIVKWLDSFKGAAEKASGGYGAAVNQYNNAITQLKVSIGKELIPVAVNLTQTLTSAINLYNNLSEGTKTITGNTALFSIAIAGSASAALSAIIQIQAFTASLTAAQIAALGFAGPIAAAAIIIGALGNTVLETSYKLEKLKAEKVEAEAKKMSDGFRELRQAIQNVNDTPVDIVIKKSPEEIQKEIDDIEQVIEEYRRKKTEKQSEQTFAYKFAETKSASAGISDFAGQQIEMKAEDARKYFQRHIEEDEKTLVTTQKGTQAYLNLRASINDATDALSALDRQLEQTDPVMNKNIKTAEDYRDKLVDAAEYQKKFLSGKFPEASKPSVGPVDTRETVEDNVLKEKIQYYQDDLDHLRSYFSTYRLTCEQQVVLKEAINKKLKSLDQEWSQSSRDVWDNYIKDLDTKLTNETINQEQYSKSIQNFIDTNKSLGLEEVNDGKLYLEIKKKLADSEKKIRDDALSGSKKQAEEWKKLQKDKAAAEEEAWKKTIQTQAETLEAEGKTVEAKKLLLKTKEKDLRDSGVAETEIVKWKEAQIQKIEADGLEEAKKKAEEKLKANKEIEEAIAGLSESTVERQISSIKKQAEEWEKSGADIIKIEEYKNKAIQKFQEETFQDFKQKEEQKKKEIEDTAKTIQSINDKIAANNQKIKDLESGSSFGAGSPLMSAEEALSKSFSKHLDPYIEKLEQSKALEQENQALMSERDKAFQKEQEQQSELKKIQEERNAAQDAFNTALQGTVDKYSAVSQTSPWEAEKKKIEEATAAAEKYNSVTSGGGQGAGSDADKKGGGGGGGDSEGGSNGSGDQGNSSPGDKSPSTGNQNYIPAYVPQGQGGNNPRSSTQGQGGNLPSNYTKGGFSTNTSNIYNPYAGQFGTGNTPQSLQLSVNPSRINQGWDWTPNYSILGDLGSWGFDNPANDTMAFKAMEKMTSDFAIPIVTKSMKDMVMNMLGGMVSSVSNIVNTPSYNTTSSQVSNYKSTTNITNYNTSLDNKQIAIATPVERSVRELNALTVKFRRL